MMPGSTTKTTNQTIAIKQRLHKRSSSAAAAQRQPLGNNADFASRTKKADQKKKRFQLQKAARKILPNKHRIQSCHRTTAYGTIYATIETNGERSRLAGVHTCDSAVCPVCAPKIAMQHAKELAAACTAAYAKGWRVLHITYTLSHHKGESLEHVLSSIASARRKYFTAGRGYQSVKKQAGIEGSARSLESTVGANGWHPHFHELLFCSGEIPDDFEAQLKTLWGAAVAKVGGYADEQHGLVVEEGSERISDYLNKFGRLPEEGGHSVEMELSHGHSKIARKGGKTPFALLDAASKGDDNAARLFCEYAACMAGRSLIRWSKGLREALDLSLQDSESADLSEDVFVEVAALSWQALMEISNDSLFPAVLAAADAGFAVLKTLLDLYDIVEDPDYPRLFVPRRYLQVAINRRY